MLWLSTKRNTCDSNYPTFRLPWVHSFHCPSKIFILFSAVHLRISFFFRWEIFKWTLDSEVSQSMVKEINEMLAQLKRQHFLSLDSQSKNDYDLHLLSECFSCITCKKDLSHDQFVMDENKNIYCSEDWAKQKAYRCTTCKKPIVPSEGQKTAPRLRALGKDYHPNCFKCEVRISPRAYLRIAENTCDLYLYFIWYLKML